MSYSLQDNNLIISYSEFVGYPSFLYITPWDKGISWHSVVDGDVVHSKGFLDDPGLLLYPIFKSNNTCGWKYKIPMHLHADLLNYEKEYNLPIYSLLYILSRYQKAIDLFKNDRNLIVLLMYSAKKHRWSESYISDLLQKNKTCIFSMCGYSNRESHLNIFNNIYDISINQYEYLTIKNILYNENIYRLCSLKYIKFRLIVIILEYPELLTSKLLQSYQVEWNINKFKKLYTYTKSMAGSDNLQTVLNCSSITELLALREEKN